MELEQMKKGRRPYRGQLTKVINEVEAMFKAGNPEVKKAKAKLQLLCKFNITIEEWDDKIKVQMSDDNIGDDEVEKEYDDMTKYQDSFLETKSELEDFLDSQAVKENPPQRPPSPSGSFQSFSAAGAGFHSTNVRLPVIELIKFNGELKEWLGFWSQFKKIHDDVNLEGCDKLHYLQQSMVPGTTAHQIATSYPQTSDNYQLVVDALLAEYNDDDVLLQVYVRELLKLVITNVNATNKIPLESLVIQLDTQLRALETLKLEDADPATWLFPLVESCLPEEILKNWQHSPLAEIDGSQDNPPRSRLKILMEFLKKEVAIKKKIRLAQSGFQEETKRKGSKGNKNEDKLPTLAGFHIADTTSSCIFCGKGHQSQDCFTAMRMSLDEKKKVLHEKGACFNCLKPGHNSAKCHSKVMCACCKRRHYALMCSSKGDKEQGTQQQFSGMRPESAPKSRSADWAQPKSVTFQNDTRQHDNGTRPKSNLANKGMWSIPPEDKNISASQNVQDASNLVCTAQVKLMTLLVDIVGDKTTKTVRAVLDPGSHRSYILNSTAEELEIQSDGEEMANHSLFGGLRTQTVRHKKFDVLIQRHGGGYCGEFLMRGSQKICNPIPRIPRTPELFDELKKNRIYVTDVENSHDTCLPEIEMLIGGDIYGCLLTGRIVQLNNRITAHETKLGWALSGGQEDKSGKDNVSMMVMTMTAMDAPIEDLWKLEAIGIHDDSATKPTAQRELEEKEQFMQTIRRKDDGRYIIKLPFQEGHPHLPDNKQVALKRLERTSAKLIQMEKFEAYDSILKEWANEFTEEVSAVNEDGAHYIPHRPVFKDSLTTPVRPVFDCSCKIGKAPSLNDCLQKGSNYVLLIPELILRFRENIIGITADIRKAFQMIEIQLKDRKYVRFLWWKNYEDRTLMEYQHRRVVFGATCSPFILGAVLEFHLKRTSPPDDVIATKLLEGFYVDNYVGSEDSPAKYQNVRERATRILADAKMDLRMWMSNIDEFDDPETLTTSILGIQWDRQADTLFVPVNGIQKPETLTKRTLLSTIQKIFDPVGLLSPALIPMKMILQKQWINNKKWDDALPEEEARTFQDWFLQLNDLEDIKIPRNFNSGVKDRTKWSLHTFTDASSFAFACVAFLRVETNDDVKLHFLMSKARVSPVKRMTIPRAELMGCLIGSRLAVMIKKALNIQEIEEHYWSDSTTALAWIKREYHHEVFVRNRVKEIREKTRREDWRHVPGIMNPADLPSRGCYPSELRKLKWWEGPEWLKSPPSSWPSAAVEEDEEAIMTEVKKSIPVITACLMDGARRDYTFAQRIRIMAWVKRFIRNCRGLKVSAEHLTEQEIQQAELAVLKEIQEDSFHDAEELRVQMKFPVFRSESGLLRLKTRLTKRDDLLSFKAPIILPSKHDLVRKIIMEEHLKNCHGGTNFLMANLREKYWILQARRTIKSVIHSCYRCRRYAAKPAVVEEGPLPEDRIKNAEPFEVTGIDLAGPLILKNNQKTWIVLYTCAVYRAVSLDLVTSLTTAAFVKSMAKFVEKHGRPSVIYTDNGTNFRGADNLFQQLDWNVISAESNLKPIQWKFNPPTAAWWGGWWERLIRTVKDLLRKTLGKATVTQSELKMQLKKVEEVMNNRPLTYVSEDPTDLEPLTPAMFLKTPARCDFPEAENEKGKLQSRYKHMMSIKEELKNRFRSEYLAMLISKPKKLTKKLEKGELVFVGSDLRKRMEWQLGRILEFIPGEQDPVNRLARVKTAEKEIIIPVQRLHPLELDVNSTVGKVTRSGKVQVPECLGVEA